MISNLIGMEHSSCHLYYLQSKFVQDQLEGSFHFIQNKPELKLPQKSVILNVSNSHSNGWCTLVYNIVIIVKLS